MQSFFHFFFFCLPASLADFCLCISLTWNTSCVSYWPMKEQCIFFWFSNFTLQDGILVVTRYVNIQNISTSIINCFSKGFVRSFTFFIWNVLKVVETNQGIRHMWSGSWDHWDSNRLPHSSSAKFRRSRKAYSDIWSLAAFYKQRKHAKCSVQYVSLQ